METSSLAERLRYPAIWLTAGLLTDELVEIQRREYVLEYGRQKPRGGTEHFRYGAFHYHLKRADDVRMLELLLEAAKQDPDKPMAGAAMKDIVGHSLSTKAMLDQAIAITATSKEYYASKSELEKCFDGKASKGAAA